MVVIRNDDDEDDDDAGSAVRNRFDRQNVRFANIHTPLRLLNVLARAPYANTILLARATR